MSKQTVRFYAFQKNDQGEVIADFEIEADVLSAKRNRHFGETIKRFLRWYNVMKQQKVLTGFKGNGDIFFTITVDGFEVVNTEVLKSKFKVMTKFRLNKTARAQKRFTSLAWALFLLSEDFAKKAKRVSDEVSIEQLLDMISKEADAEIAVMQERRRLSKLVTTE